MSLQVPTWVAGKGAGEEAAGVRQDSKSARGPGHLPHVRSDPQGREQPGRAAALPTGTVSAADKSSRIFL